MARDKSKLIKKTIRDKLGRARYVWVKPDQFEEKGQKHSMFVSLFSFLRSKKHAITQSGLSGMFPKFDVTKHKDKKEAARALLEHIHSQYKAQKEAKEKKALSKPRKPSEGKKRVSIGTGPKRKAADRALMRDLVSHLMDMADLSKDEKKKYFELQESLSEPKKEKKAEGTLRGRVAAPTISQPAQREAIRGIEKTKAARAAEEFKKMPQARQEYEKKINAAQSIPGPIGDSKAYEKRLKAYEEAKKFAQEQGLDRQVKMADMLIQKTKAQYEEVAPKKDPKQELSELEQKEKRRLYDAIRKEKMRFEQLRKQPEFKKLSDEALKYALDATEKQRISGKIEGKNIHDKFFSDIKQGKQLIRLKDQKTGEERTKTITKNKDGTIKLHTIGPRGTTFNSEVELKKHLETKNYRVIAHGEKASELKRKEKEITSEQPSKKEIKNEDSKAQKIKNVLDELDQSFEYRFGTRDISLKIKETKPWSPSGDEPKRIYLKFDIKGGESQHAPKNAYYDINTDTIKYENPPFADSSKKKDALKSAMEDIEIEVEDAVKKQLQTKKGDTISRISYTIEGFDIEKADVPGTPTGTKGSMSTQSVTFPENWSRERVVKWLKDHNYKASSVEKEGKRWRARQYNPEHFGLDDGWATKDIGGGVQLVMGRLKKTRKA